MSAGSASHGCNGCIKLIEYFIMCAEDVETRAVAEFCLRTRFVEKMTALLRDLSKHTSRIKDAAFKETKIRQEEEESLKPGQCFFLKI